jgi:hypothetical protein
VDHRKRRHESMVHRKRRHESMVDYYDPGEVQFGVRVLDLAFYINYEGFKGVTFIISTVFSVLIKYLTPVYGLDQLVDWLEFQLPK